MKISIPMYNTAHVGKMIRLVFEDERDHYNVWYIVIDDSQNGPIVGSETKQFLGTVSKDEMKRLGKAS